MKDKFLAFLITFALIWNIIPLNNIHEKAHASDPAAVQAAVDAEYPDTLNLILPASINRDDVQAYVDGTLSVDKLNVLEPQITDLELALMDLPQASEKSMLLFFDQDGEIIARNPVQQKTRSMVSASSTPETSPATGAPSTNKIDFYFPTTTGTQPSDTNCSSGLGTGGLGWNAGQLSILNQAEEEGNGKDGNPGLTTLFGAPFSNFDGSSQQTPKVCVIYNPSQSSAGLTDSTFRIFLRDPGNEVPLVYNTVSKDCFWHEWSHVIHGYSRFQLNSKFGEEFAQLGMFYIGKNEGFDDKHILPDVSDYDQYNNPYFSQDLLSSNQIDALKYARDYSTASVVLIKIMEQYPTAISEFDKRLYDYWQTLGGANVAFGGTKEFVQMMSDTLLSLGDGTIEGEPFADWFMKQYTFAQPVGVKFGVRIGQEQRDNMDGTGQNKITARFGFYQVKEQFTNVNNNRTIRTGSDAPYGGSISYHTVDSEGNTLFSGESYVLASNYGGIDGGDSGLIDLTSKFETIPTGRVCLVADINGTGMVITGRSSCYYLRGETKNYNSIGITGSIGNESNVNLTGTVKITPMQGQGVTATSVPVVAGGFMAPSFATASGLFKLDYISSSGKTISTKYIVKDENNFIYTNIPVDSNEPSLQSLMSSSISSGKSTISTKAKGIVQININRSGTPSQQFPIEQYCKYYDESGNIAAGLTSLLSTDKYSVNLISFDGKIQKGPYVDFGTPSTTQVSIYKSSSPSGVVSSGDEIRYDMIVNNQTVLSVNDNTITDPIPDGTTYVEGSATINDQSVTDTDADNDFYKFINNIPTWHFDTLAQRSQPNSSYTLSFRVKVN